MIQAAPYIEKSDDFIKRLVDEDTNVKGWGATRSTTKKDDKVIANLIKNIPFSVLFIVDKICQWGYKHVA